MSRSAPANWRPNVAINLASASFSCKDASIFGNFASSGSSSSGQRVRPSRQPAASRACRSGGTASRAKPAPSRASRRSRRTLTASTGLRAACACGFTATPIGAPVPGVLRSQAGRHRPRRAARAMRPTACRRTGIGMSPGVAGVSVPAARRCKRAPCRGATAGALAAIRFAARNAAARTAAIPVRGIAWLDSAHKKRGPGASSSPAGPEDSSCGMAPAEAGWMQATAVIDLMQ